ncbi:MAG: phospholipase D-like domain-containing protein [Candidatus Saccharimonadota bacterium]
MKLISPTGYVSEAAAAVRKASSRVYVLSMVIADHPDTHELIVELENAAKRGVEVVVAADIFTYGEVSGGFLPLRYYSHGARSTNRMVKVLKKAGVHFYWLGRGRVTLYHGRTHSKWCIVDDTVFAFGGVNLYDEGIQHIDYMFRHKDSKLADRLVQEQKRVQKAERRSANYPSVAYEHGDLTVLIDGGIIGQSVIYRRAVEMAEKATHITFVSQYCPTGRLSRTLKKKSATLYFNRPSQAEGLNRIAIRIGQFASGLKTSYTKARYLHAKFILFTFEDGSKAAISGSHNFAYTGVLLGTREVALETKDPEIIAQLERFIEKEVK